MSFRSVQVESRALAHGGRRPAMRRAHLTAGLRGMSLTSASRLVLATLLATGTLVAARPANAAVVNVATEGATLPGDSEDFARARCAA